MKKVFAFVLLFSISITHFFSQTSWQKTYNITGVNKTIQTVDGGFANVGSVSSAPTAGMSDIVLTKYDVNGNVQWSHIYGGTNNEYGYLIAQASDSSYYIAGTSSSFSAYSEAILLHTDKTGTLLWSKQLDNYGSSVSSLTTAGTDAILTGYRNSTSSQTNKYGYIYRISNTGISSLNNGMNANSGYISDAIGILTSDGGYIYAASQKSTTSAEIIIGKYTSNFTSSWLKVVSGSGSDFVKSIQQTTDGGFIVCGITTSFGQGGLDAYLMKMDASGNILWYKTYGDAETNTGWFVRQTSDGGYVMLGSSTHSGNMNINLIKTDSIGELMWAKEYDNGGNEDSRTVYQTVDGGYIISGLGANTYLLKADINGNAGGCGAINYYPKVFSYSPTTTNDPPYYTSSTVITPAPVQNPRTVTKTDICSQAFCNVDAKFSPDNSIVVQGTTVVFANNSTNASAYNWLNGTTSFSTASNSNYQFNAPGTYTITLIAGNGTCNDSAFHTIVVTPSITNSSWQKKYNSKQDVAYGTTIQTLDGGYANVGIAQSSLMTTAGQNDILFTKFDANGNIQWSKSYGGTLHDLGFLVAQANDGSYYIAGTSSSFSAYDETILLHTDVNGKLLWSKSFDNYGSSPSSLTTLGTDAILTGYRNSTSSQTNKYGYIYRIAANGNSTLNNGMNANSGYLSNAIGIATADGGYVMAATQKSTTSPEIIVGKYTSNFTSSWLKVISGSGNDYVGAIKQTSDGGYIICGTTTSFGQGQYDAYLLKLDVSGNISWYKTYGDADRNYGLDVVQNANGGYTILGSTSVGGTNENIFLINTSSNGNVVWSKMYDDGFNNQASRLFKTSNNGYIINAVAGNSGGLLWLIRTDSLGVSGACNTSNYSPIYFNYSPTIANDPPYYTSSVVISPMTVENKLQVSMTPICSQLNCPIVSMFNVSPNTTTVCQGDTLYFSNNSNGGATTFNWLVNNSSVSTDSVAGIVFSLPGTFIVKFAAGNGSCVDTSSITITVNPLPANVGTISGNATVCAGSANTYSIAAVSGATSYTWTLPGGWSGSSSTNSINVIAGSASGNISVAAVNGCGASATQTYSVTVNPLPTVLYTQSPSIVCVGVSQTTLSAGNPSGGVYTGQTVTGNTFFPSTAGIGSYVITYTYTDINSCVNSDTSLIVVDPCTSINGANENEITVYPNPAYDFIFVNGIKSAAEVKILNIVGELVYTNVVLKDNAKIDLSKLSKGVYFIQLNINDQIMIYKIVKE